MPEGLEAEIWRRACEPLVGRTVTDVDLDARVADPEVRAVACGSRIDEVGRVGKVLTVDLDNGHRLGLHFGMTGRLVIDGGAPIDRLEYASGSDDPEWDRLRLRTDGAGAGDAPALRMNDPRRLGRISVDPDLSKLGPDALGLGTDELATALAGRRAAIKTLLLDQSVVAGLGNLCADEVLLHAGIAPSRGADTLDVAEIERLATACRDRLPVMLELGGSTEGDLTPELRRGPGPCPLDQAPLSRTTIGGRTAVWCPRHQH